MNDPEIPVLFGVRTEINRNGLQQQRSTTAKPVLKSLTFEEYVRPVPANRVTFPPRQVSNYRKVFSRTVAENLPLYREASTQHLTYEMPNMSKVDPSKPTIIKQYKNVTLHYHVTNIQPNYHVSNYGHKEAGPHLIKSGDEQETASNVQPVVALKTPVEPRLLVATMKHDTIPVAMRHFHQLPALQKASDYGRRSQYQANAAQPDELKATYAPSSLETVTLPPPPPNQLAYQRPVSQQPEATFNQYQYQNLNSNSHPNPTQKAAGVEVSGLYPPPASAPYGTLFQPDAAAPPPGPYPQPTMFANPYQTKVEVQRLVKPREEERTMIGYLPVIRMGQGMADLKPLMSYGTGPYSEPMVPLIRLVPKAKQEKDKEPTIPLLTLGMKRLVYA